MELNNFLFTGIPVGECEALMACLPPPREFSKGDGIYSCHDFQRALGVLLEGEAEVSRPCADGHRVVMNRLKAGGIFGAAALFGDCSDYVTEIRAATTCRVLFIPQDQMLELMKRDFRLAENYIRFLSGRVRFLNEKIASFTDGQTDDRLRRYLLQNSDESGRVALPRSMVELAQTLNMGRSSLYRSLDALEAAGLIRREGKKLFICDRQRLLADWI